MSYKTQRSLSLAVLLLTFALTFLPEFVLVERKYAIFQGGYGAPETLQSMVDILIFLVVVLACHIGLIVMLYWIAFRLSRRKADYILFNYNFIFFTVAIVITALAVKFKVLDYFSDAISFQLIKKTWWRQLDRCLSVRVGRGKPYLRHRSGSRGLLLCGIAPAATSEEGDVTAVDIGAVAADDQRMCRVDRRRDRNRGIPLFEY